MAGEIQQPAVNPTPAPAASGDKKEKMVAALLAIFLGWLGIHKFYLGYKNEGIIMLAVTVVVGGITCGAGISIMSLIGLIEGILYLTKSDDEFQKIYVQNKKAWF